MSKSVLSLSVFTMALSLPLVAAAQQAQGGGSDCPPGSWFCEEAESPQPAPSSGQATQPLQPLPSANTPDSTTAAPVPPPPPPYPSSPPPAPPVVVYQPAPPVMVVKQPEAPPPYQYKPRPPVYKNQWGLNLHLEGLSIGKGVHGNAGMGGGGVGLRFRPVPQVALEGDLDFVGGRDYQGMKRNETAFAINTLIFLNPRSKWQVYLLAGLGVSGARVRDDYGDNSTRRYAYFGGQAGGGLELRLSQHFALNVDLRGFIRERIDEDALYVKEFRDARGRSTNTSGGGLLTGGMTIYF